MALTIAEAAATCGLSADTLRYYERDGLLVRPVARSASGHRRYTDEDLGWIEMVTRLRATGMPIREVRRYAALIRAGDGNEPARLGLLRAHRERVLAELAVVQAHLAAIDAKIDLYAGRVEPVERSA
jgi:DNA-binding transcriptional MerR regulator